MKGSVGWEREGKKMAFCTQCGYKVEDGDKFCLNCGAPVRQPVKDDVMDDGTAAGVNEKADMGAKAETESKAGADDGAATTTAKFDAEKTVKGVPPTSVKSVNKKLPTPAKPVNKKLIGGIVAGVLLFAVIAVLIWKAGDFGAVRDKADYVPYVNDTVCFSVDYPEEYLVTETNVNSVLITEGEAADFQVSIEYAYYTVGDSAIYSAADFVEQVENDPAVLTDWIGTANVEAEYVGRTKTGNMEHEQYHFRLEVEGHPYEGYLYVYDGQGEFGCYTYMCAINQDAEDAELFKIQAGKMADSFQITNSCQAEGYHVYTYEEAGLQFMVRDEAIYDSKESDGDVTVYPVERVYSESNIWMEETSYEADVDVNDVIEGISKYYFSSKKKTEYLNEPTRAQCGRYPFTGVDLQFYDDGEWYVLTEMVFVHDDVYWRITMKSTEEYYDITATAMSDILFSLKFMDDADSADARNADGAKGDSKGGQDEGGAEGDSKSGQDEGGASKNGDSKDKSDGNGKEASSDGAKVADVIAKIEAKTGYVSDGTFKPLVVAEDFNGDGTRELLAVYEIESGSGVSAMYDVWSLGEKKSVCLKSEELFWEVGGNSGSVGIAKSNDKAYLAIEAKEPDGDGFNNYYEYIPWSETKSEIEEDGGVYMESHGNVEQPDKSRYIVGDTTVEKSEFDERQKDFEWIYKLDILAGATDDGVMTFDEMR